MAGGGSVDVLLNCPDKEFAEKVLDAAAQGVVDSLPYGLGL